MSRKAWIGLGLGLAVAGALAAVAVWRGTLPPAASWATYQYDAARTGWNPNERSLSVATVNPRRFRRLWTLPLDGQVYAQPLVLAGVSVPGRGRHNLLFVATEHDSVYAFDADRPGAPLWRRSLGAAVPSGYDANGEPREIPCRDLAPEVGITGTPVIDPSIGVLYVVAKRMVGAAIVQELHALDVRTGEDRAGSPVRIAAAVRGHGAGSTGRRVAFDAGIENQRAGLALVKGVVYAAWASHCDQGAYHGWLLGYDARTLRPAGVLNTSPNGRAAGIWQSGAAPAADAAGHLFVITGNGSFNLETGGRDAGESFLKIRAGRTLAIQDYFTPHNYATLNKYDWDLGSGGVVLIPTPAGSPRRLMAGAGKEGRLYLLDRDRLGGFSRTVDSVAQALPPGVVGRLPGIRVFSAPACWTGPRGPVLFWHGTGDRLKALPLVDGRLPSQPASQSPSASPFPGATPAVSSDATIPGTAVVWELTPRVDPRRGSGPAVLRAFDARDLSHQLFDSEQNPGRDRPGGYVKFSVPTIANGKVYAGTATGVAVYGLSK